jgi:hypothetical protein
MCDGAPESFYHPSYEVAAIIGDREETRRQGPQIGFTAEPSQTLLWKGVVFPWDPTLSH